LVKRKLNAGKPGMLAAGEDHARDAGAGRQPRECQGVDAMAAVVKIPRINMLSGNNSTLAEVAKASENSKEYKVFIRCTLFT
jgi:hypothetical protein